MKMRTILGLLIVLALALAGCASQPKPKLSKAEVKEINWNERIGVYTYGEALADLGKPAVISDSNDGRTAEWILRQNPQISFGFGVGGGSYGGRGGAAVGVGTGFTPPPSGEYLRLRFDQTDKLAEWSKVQY